MEQQVWSVQLAKQSILRPRVAVPSEEGNGEQDLNDPGVSTVSTRQETDTQAFTIAKQWIDERLAGRRQDRALPRPE
jgi:hypothetical protein